MYEFQHFKAFSNGKGICHLSILQMRNSFHKEGRKKQNLSVLNSTIDF